ncbi:MAG: hypothetical protein ACRCUE_03690 [Bosea sp. (in: a-proteobacteria)]
MRWITTSLLGIVLGYAIGISVGVALTVAVSTNNHDKSLEMAMTAFFFTGPIGAVFGVLVAVGVMLVRKRRQGRS